MLQFLLVVYFSHMRIRTLICTISVIRASIFIITVVYLNGIVCMTGWASLKYDPCVFSVFAFIIFLGVQFLTTNDYSIIPVSIILHCVAAVVFFFPWVNICVQFLASVPLNLGVTSPILFVLSSPVCMSFDIR